MKTKRSSKTTVAAKPAPPKPAAIRRDFPPQKDARGGLKQMESAGK